MKKIFVAVMAAAMLLAACGTGNDKKSTDMDISSYASPNQEGMQKVCSFVKGCGNYFLATEEGDQPRVRPFGTFEIIEGKLYIQTGHVKNVAKQIAVNPKVEICAFNGSEWIRIAATLVEDPRVETKAAMLDANPSLKRMYSAEDENTAVYFLKDATATINSFTAPSQTIEF
ncbi:MAG: NimC/NimA family protein [Bacteroidales bacterium]|nr:NimC/NimA family protein [Bacteroidales bacterium]